MRRIVLLGLGQFNKELIAELRRAGPVRIIAVDRVNDLVEQYKDRVDRSYIADVTREQTMRRVIGTDTDVAVIDLGAERAITILAVNHLKRIGVPTIVARADSDEFARVLQTLGVSQVVMPGWEAAQRIGPPLLLSGMTNYLPISSELVMAEVVVPPTLRGQSTVSGEIRARYRVNIVAIRSAADADYTFPDLAYQFEATDLLLVVGSENAISEVAGAGIPGDSAAGTERPSLLKRVLLTGRIRPRKRRNRG